MNKLFFLTYCVECKTINIHVNKTTLQKHSIGIHCFKMRIAILTILSVIALIEGRAPKNCGLSCFRWKKCMGVVGGGGNRPGQLGDTGIIVLQHCGPLKKKGCECNEEKQEEESHQEKQETSSQASRSHHAFQPRQLTRNRGFSRNSRKRVFSGILRVEIINCNQRLA